LIILSKVYVVFVGLGFRMAIIDSLLNYPEMRLSLSKY